MNGAKWGGLAAVAAVAWLLTVAFPIPAAGKAAQCARLIPTGGTEVIVNVCQQCRVVSVIRSRPGNEVPVSRSYNVPARSTFPMPFKGPGRSRISSDLPCKGEDGAAENLLDPKPARQADDACVKLGRADGGAVVLVNGCRACKAVLVERVNAQGRGTGRQAYEVAANGAVAVASQGAAAVGVLAEIDCPK